MTRIHPNGSGPPAEEPCAECEDWHDRLIAEARGLQLIGGALVLAILALALAAWLRGRA